MICFVVVGGSKNFQVLDGLKVVSKNASYCKARCALDDPIQVLLHLPGMWPDGNALLRCAYSDANHLDQES